MPRWSSASGHGRAAVETVIGPAGVSGETSSASARRRSLAGLGGAVARPPFRILQWPSKSTPSSSTTTGLDVPPLDLAAPRSSTARREHIADDLAVDQHDPARTVALTMPFSPMIRLSVE